MKFMVRRTSSRDRNPCEGAYKETYTRHDIREVADPPSMYVCDLREGRREIQWEDHGENHRVENGHAIRDFPDTPGWFIDIDGLAALKAFINKYGRVVIRPPLPTETGDHGCPVVLEIYDCYRE